MKTILRPLICFLLLEGITSVAGWREPEEVKFIQVTATTTPTQIDLSDGSKVWFSKQSSLILPERFPFRAERRVILIGEALFEVAEGPAFSVSCDGLVITTSHGKFSISKDRNTFEVIAYSNGITATIPGNPERTLRLKHLEKLTLGKGPHENRIPKIGKIKEA